MKKWSKSKMKSINKKLKLLALACLLAIFVDIASSDQSMQIFAYESASGRNIYDGYAAAQSENYYNDNLSVSSNPMITVLTPRG